MSFQANEMERSGRSVVRSVEAVIFDWAGTVVDYGSIAPVDGFCLLFSRHGVEITLSEARIPMGAEKREHIAALLNMPRIRQSWIDAHGKEPSETDIDQLYSQFISIQIEAIGGRAELIPGARETFECLVKRGIKVGSNTGYSQEMITGLVASAASQGFSPASVVAATDVPRGRPYPHMMLKNIIELEVKHLHACVKVDDTLPGIDEGLNAGAWTVGIAISGNEIGMEQDEWLALPKEEQQALRKKAYARFLHAGAHYVIDSVADLPQVIDDIERSLKSGKRP